MTIKSALSVIALAAGLVAAPALAQSPTMIGSQTIAESDVEAVAARCMDLQVASDTESLVTASSDDSEEESDTAGEATLANEPATDAETATSVDLDLVTIEDCEAGGWFDM